MTSLHLPLNTKVQVYGSEFKVVCHTASNEFNLANIETGKPLLIEESTLTSLIMKGEAEIECFRQYGAGKNKSQIKRSFESFSADNQEEARRRLKYVKAVHQRISDGSLSSAVCDVLKFFAQVPEECLPSQRTVERWYRAWCDGGHDLRALLPADFLKGRRAKIISGAVAEILDEVIEDFYLIATPYKVNQLFQILRGRIEKQNLGLPRKAQLKVPNIRSVYRYVRALEPFEVAAAQHGVRAAKAKYDAVGAGITARHPLEIVQVDHHLVDLQLILRSGTILGRPWLTLAIDLYSRMVVGFYLSFNAPSYISVMRCLKHAIAPKEMYLQQVAEQLEQHSDTSYNPEFASNWPCFGLIDTLVLDNGPEFHSQHLLDGMAQLGTSVEYNPSYSPHYKGVVERWFGTLNTKLVHTFPGTTFSNPDKRGNYPSEKEACLTIEEFEFLLTKFIVDDYANCQHSSLKCTPAQKWREGTRKHPVHFISSQQDLNVLLFKIETRTLGRNGIAVAGLSYQSEAIQLLRRRLIGNSSLGPKNPRVRIKVDPEDLSTIYVEDQENSVFIPANCIYETYALRLSMWRHKVIRSLIQDTGSNPDKSSESELLDRRLSVFEASRQIISDAQKTKRKQAYRYQNEELRSLSAIEAGAQAGRAISAPSEVEAEDYEAPFFSSEEIEAELIERGWHASRAGDGANPDAEDPDNGVS
jgi:putative transposase